MNAEVNSMNEVSNNEYVAIDRSRGVGGLGKNRVNTEKSVNTIYKTALLVCRVIHQHQVLSVF